MKKWVIANLKMNKTNTEICEYALSLKKNLKKCDARIAVCPSFVSISELAKIMKKTKILVGSQNIAANEQGAYTGEVSAKMLKDVGSQLAIIGHSERRRYYGETDEIVNKKILMAQSQDILPVVCLVYDGGDSYQEDLKNQLNNVLQGVDKQKPIVFALEPVWAIGTGKSMANEDIEPAIDITKSYAKHLLGYEPDVLYGGSVNSVSVVPILRMKQCDGFLVGTACKDVLEFTKLCEITANN